ncbi:uncharacterized protein [Rutidosis leptorrhynchoides]|uniref:uncharacterized protein n=1 Tax=Rutidosis leptorrhynchoides TaxID=125765 RepID=UPI003A98E824
MDPLRIHAYKIHAIKKHKRQQFVGTVLLYSFSTLSCMLLCSSPLWYPPFCATFNVVFFLSVPKICSFFFTSKVLFVVGNLIVIFLVGESKFFTSKSKALSAKYGDVCYDGYKCKIPKAQVLSPSNDGSKRDKGINKSQRGEIMIVKKLNCENLEEVSLAAEELNKLADDFIARVNRQRRLEVLFPRS